MLPCPLNKSNNTLGGSIRELSSRIYGSRKISSVSISISISLLLFGRAMQSSTRTRDADSPWTATNPSLCRALSKSCRLPFKTTVLHGCGGGTWQATARPIRPFAITGFGETLSACHLPSPVVVLVFCRWACQLRCRTRALDGHRLG